MSTHNYICCPLYRDEDPGRPPSGPRVQSIGVQPPHHQKPVSEICN